MAFNSLTGCDSSDVQIWASSPVARNFIEEVVSRRETALRELIKSPSEESAAIVRAYDHVLGLFKEARELK